MMKKLLLAILCTMSCYAYSEINTKVYNNYIVLSSPEYAPHSIPIKRQETLFNIRVFDFPIIRMNEFLDNKKIIKSNNEGFIVSSYSRQYRLSVNMVYKKQEIIAVFHDLGDSFFFILDKNNNILITSNLLLDELKWTLYSYDDNKLIKKHFNYNNRNNNNGYYTMDIVYTDNALVKQIVEKEFDKSVSDTLLEMKTKEFTYDSDGKLIETVLKIDFNLSKNQEKDVRIHCYFTNHNKHGDWTKGYCVDSRDLNVGNITRTIEYWE